MIRLLLVLFILSLIRSAIADQVAWEVETRQLPVPLAASQELQEAIAAGPKPDVAAAKTAPASEAEWLEMIRQTNVIRARASSEMVERLAVNVREDQIGGVNVYRVMPAQTAAQNEKRLFLYLHGGAYITGEGTAALTEPALIAQRVSIPVLTVDYRMPPAHPFPAAVDDVVSVWREITKTQAAHSIVLGGTSAGAGLALAAVHRFRQLNLPIPAAVYAGTPWADLAKTGDTLFSNEGIDRVLVTYDGTLGEAAELYAAGEDMKNPLLSPIYGDFRNFPPTILVSGTRDLLLSDTVRTHRKMRAAGVLAELHVFEGYSHADYLLAPDTPESTEVYRELGKFIEAHLSQN